MLPPESAEHLLTAQVAAAKRAVAVCSQRGARVVSAQNVFSTSVKLFEHAVATGHAGSISVARGQVNQARDSFDAAIGAFKDALAAAEKILR